MKTVFWMSFSLVLLAWCLWSDRLLKHLPETVLVPTETTNTLNSQTARTLGWLGRTTPDAVAEQSATAAPNPDPIQSVVDWHERVAAVAVEDTDETPEQIDLQLAELKPE